MTRTSATADAVDLWSPLEAGCAAALALSRALESRIEAGAGAAELVPLLEQERQAVEALRGQIADIGGRAGTATAPSDDAAARRDGIAAQLQELLRVDTRSRELLSRRGVRLKPPRWRRGATRKGS